MLIHRNLNQLAIRCALAVLGNVLIGLLLTVVGFGGTLGVNLVYSECIGLSIFGLICTVFALTARGSALRLALLLAAIALGGTVGQIVANLLTRSSPQLLPDYFLKSEFIGLFFGAIGATAMFLRERYWDLEARRIEAEKRGIEAQLRMLQAQVEPHFLFNTLANLAGLIEADPKLAGRLLEALNRYLRASLQRTRAEGGTLGDELDLLEAYLEVFRIRLGQRLDYSFSVAPELRGLPFPPMLLQPLVENAIRHGIEPQVAGGRIRIAAARAGGLELTVQDTGCGLGDEPGSGFGLDNVRARLAALFGDAGSLEIAQGPEGGVLATLRLPS
jgi:sensor histidine kinase YesM